MFFQVANEPKAITIVPLLFQAGTLGPRGQFSWLPLVQHAARPSLNLFFFFFYSQSGLHGPSLEDASSAKSRAYVTAYKFWEGINLHIGLSCVLTNVLNSGLSLLAAASLKG